MGEQQALPATSRYIEAGEEVFACKNRHFRSVPTGTLRYGDPQYNARRLIKVIVTRHIKRWVTLLPRYNTAYQCCKYSKVRIPVHKHLVKILPNES